MVSIVKKLFGTKNFPDMNEAEKATENMRCARRELSASLETLTATANSITELLRNEPKIVTPRFHRRMARR